MDIKKMKQEILDTEAEFLEVAQKYGLHHAFTTFADDNAVICRNNQLIKGKTAIAKYFEENQHQSSLIKWTPEYVDVTMGGEQAYTYGVYKMSTIDKNGGRNDVSGIFHTVWKRQKDNSWKYVWD